MFQEITGRQDGATIGTDVRMRGSMSGEHQDGGTQVVSILDWDETNIDSGTLPGHDWDEVHVGSNIEGIVVLS